MNRAYSKIIELIHFGSDILWLNLSFFLAYIIKIPTSPLVSFEDHYIFLFAFMNVAWMLLAILIKVYDVPRFSNLEKLLVKIVKAIFFHYLIIVVLIFSLKGFYFSRGLLLYGYLFFTPLILIWRITIIYFLRVYRKLGYNYKKVIIVGGGSTGCQLFNYFNSELSSGYKFEGFFDDHPEKCLYQNLVMGNLNDVEQFINKNNVDEIYCALPLTESSEIRKLMSLSDNNLVRFKIVLDFRGFLNKKVNLNFYYDTPVLSLRTEPLEKYFNRFLKRLFDVTFSLFVIIFLFPFLIPLVALAIKISSPGPVIFKQRRSGRNNKVFTCYKFRSMSTNAASDKIQAIKGDPRITRVGSFIRKSNIDEMPQFINVLLGQMSIVGPRPHMLNHTTEYAKLVDKFLVRHFVKPGITGWAQVNGFRGPTSDRKMMHKRVEFDVWYIENWSMLLDIKIILMTVFNMAKGEKHAF